jgi:hypothetical protein
LPAELVAKTEPLQIQQINRFGMSPLRHRQTITLVRGTRVQFVQPGGTPLEAGPTWDGKQVRCNLVLKPQQTVRLCVTVAPVTDGTALEPVFGCGAFGQQVTAAEAVAPAWLLEATGLETTNPTVQAAWDRGVGDLAALVLGEGATGVEQATPAAGIPHYQGLFGRDALTAAGQGLLASPRIAEGTLRLLARYIGSQEDHWNDEQPGRVLMQLRDGPLTLLNLRPWHPYYADYAAPCAFLVLLGGHHVTTGDTGFAREMLEPAKPVSPVGTAFSSIKPPRRKGRGTRGGRTRTMASSTTRDTRWRRPSPPVKSRAIGTLLGF